MTERPVPADPAVDQDRAAPDDLALALRLADTADAVTLARFRAGDLHVRRKPDRTPVTDADVACEDALRAVLAAERPGDGVVGEERGEDASGEGGRTWVIDPIDGTKNYSRGLPIWATLIALVADGRPVVGVVSAPALGRRWWAARGQGARTRDRTRGTDQVRLQVSGVRDLADAYVSTTDLDHWRVRGMQDRWLALSEATWESRGFGDFLHHCLVAEGLIDLAVEPEANAWDLAAPKILVEEAGGRLTDLTGADRYDGGTSLTSNGLLHATALAYFEGASPA